MWHRTETYCNSQQLNMVALSQQCCRVPSSDQNTAKQPIQSRIRVTLTVVYLPVLRKPHSRTLGLSRALSRLRLSCSLRPFRNQRTLTASILSIPLSLQLQLDLRLRMMSPNWWVWVGSFGYLNFPRWETHVVGRGRKEGRGTLGWHGKEYKQTLTIAYI